MATSFVRLALDALQSIVTAASSVKDLDLIASHTSESSKVLQLLADAMPFAFELAEKVQDNAEEKEPIMAALSQAAELTMPNGHSLYFSAETPDVGLCPSAAFCGLTNVSDGSGYHFRVFACRI